MKSTTYGQRGGQGPNAGRTKIAYGAIAPDGTLLTANAYTTNAPTALMNISQHNGQWVANAVRDRKAWNGQWITATRVGNDKRIGYFVEHGERHQHIKEYGQNYKAALQFARTASKRQEASTYLIAYEEDHGDQICIGHLAYLNGQQADSCGRMK